MDRRACRAIQAIQEAPVILARPGLRDRRDLPGLRDRLGHLAHRDRRAPADHSDLRDRRDRPDCRGLRDHRDRPDQRDPRAIPVKMGLTRRAISVSAVNTSDGLRLYHSIDLWLRDADRGSLSTVRGTKLLHW